MKNKLLLLIVITLLVSSLRAQTQQDLQHKAPTLQIGLDALTFNKGELDYELIMLIIAEKQQELKIKFVQNMFLDRLKNTGGTVYTYADNVIRGITSEKDPDIRARRVLESTVNVVFVAALTEYYLKRCKANEGFKQRLDELSKNYNTKVDLDNEFILKNIVRPINDDIGTVSMADDSRNLISMLIDLASEAVRSDSHLKDLGLMQISYSSTYDYLNLFLKSRRENLKDASTQKLYTDANNVYTDMKEVLIGLTSMIGVTKYLKEKYSFRNEQVTTSKSVNATASVSASNFASLEAPVVEAKTTIDFIIRKLSDPDHSYNTQMKLNISNLVKIRDYIDKATGMITEIGSGSQVITISVLSDVVYTARFELYPLLEQMAYVDADILVVLDRFRTFTSDLATILVSTNKELSGLNNKIDPFINFIAGLYEFNRAETISDYLKFVNDVGEIYPDSKVKFALSVINSFVTDYTVIRVGSSQKEVIEFNVESFLVKLQSIKRDKYSPFEFHFTVGASSGYFNKKLITQTDTLNSFSYVGEKIGLKFKLWDSEFSRSRSPGETHNFLFWKFLKTGPPREPLLSNVHFLAYGSGLLYSVLNTTNFKNFSAPIVGVGLGITFSNALDFNISKSFPVLNDRALKSSYKNSLYSLGFDIQFTEYFKRLGEKRRSKQLQEVITDVATAK